MRVINGTGKGAAGTVKKRYSEFNIMHNAYGAWRLELNPAPDES